MLTREQILGATDFKVESVEVPEWGGNVFIRSLSAKAREDWERKFLNGGLPEQLRATFLALTVCDESGTLLFSTEDVAALSAKDCRPIIRVFDAATKLNALSKADIDQLEKN